MSAMYDSFELCFKILSDVPSSCVAEGEGGKRTFFADVIWPDARQKSRPYPGFDWVMEADKYGQHWPGRFAAPAKQK